MTTTKTTRRGRPEIGDKIGVRLDPALLARIEGYAADHDMKRPEAIRQLLEQALGATAQAPSTTTAPVVADVPASLDERIMTAHTTLALRPGGWVMLSNLRDHLADVPHAELDEALSRMYANSDIKLIAEVNQKTLTDRNRAAALRILGDDKHLYQPGNIQGW